MTLSRRGFFTGLAAVAVTAPAIVRAASLMPVKRMLILPDGLDNRFEAYTSMFKWQREVIALDWRYVTRINTCEVLKCYAKIDHALALEDA